LSSSPNRGKQKASLTAFLIVSVADPHHRRRAVALYEDAKSKKWFVISMKNDWKRHFAFE